MKVLRLEERYVSAGVRSNNKIALSNVEDG